MVFILHSSDDSMTQPGPVLSVLPLWPFMCLCCTVQLHCTSLFLCNIDTQHQISPMSILSRWWQRHVTQIACGDVFFFGDLFLFSFFASQEYISFRDFLFLFCFCVLVLKKKTNKKNKGGLWALPTLASSWKLTPCILFSFKIITMLIKTIQWFFSNSVILLSLRY